MHHMTMRLPKHELHEEGGQARRSSKGIASCIVEGYGRRRYKADFIKFLTYAHASCDETILHLNFIKETHVKVKDEVDELLHHYDSLGRKINKFIKYVEMNWKSTRNPQPVTRNP